MPCDHTDVLVIGGGSAGLCAAIASARAGAKTTLIEQNGFC
ncbi:MAG: FAD-dependent oxidoreductase [Clostridia bacterium]|nr:FAD-dependent oxidoreductase [Clostridia bacterium]